MEAADVIIIGGGIAGLATAWQLARQGARTVLLEREPMLASHASGRNAAIFRQVDRDLLGARLATRSLELMASLPTGGPLLSPTGALYVGDPGRLAALAGLAERADVFFTRLDAGAVRLCAPTLGRGDVAAGLHFPGDGVLDTHALMASLAVAARGGGAQLRTGAGVRALRVSDGRVAAVLLEDGEELVTSKVVVAAGAWTAEVGRRADLPLPITPRRRHLALLTSPAGKPVGPVVWRVDDEVYFRPESGGYLASPCDEEPWEPGLPPTSSEALVTLAARLGRLAPDLGELSVRRAWACLRSFAPDGGFVVGPDPRLTGLTWIAGLGGRGMSCGLGLGEVAASAALGGTHALAAELSPARLLA